MPLSHAVLLYMTMPSLDEGKRIVRILLEEHLIACANLFPMGESVYHWEGKVVEAPESVVIAKTLASQVSLVQKRFQELHPYDCPLILTVPVEGMPPAILSWLTASLSSPES